MKRRSLLTRAAITLLPSLALLPPSAGHAHGSQLGELSLRHPHARPTLPGATTGAVYFAAIRNAGDQADRLLSASTAVADRVELHRMLMDGDVMRMRAVTAIEVPARTTVSLRQGSADGYHLMLFGLRRPLAAGDRFALTLRFDRAGEIQVEVWVESQRPGVNHSH
jgi:periplasmic copper chaperone A